MAYQGAQRDTRHSIFYGFNMTKYHCHVTFVALC